MKLTKRQRLELMGKVVSYNKTLYRGYEGPNGSTVVWKTRGTRQRCGWIVGFSYRYNGIIVHGGWIDDGVQESSYLSVTESVPVLLVCPWPTRKPVLVPLDSDWQITNEVPSFPDWNPQNRDALSEQSKTWPRDKHGRFV